MDLLSIGGFMRVRPWCFFSWLGDRACLATCRDTVGLLPILSLDRQCCRYFACVPRPFVETSESIAFASLCSPSPAKCAHLSCLISRVHSRAGSLRKCRSRTMSESQKETNNEFPKPVRT